MSQEPQRRILLGVTGSVAAVKAPEIALRLVTQEGWAVKILLTKGGRHFWDQSKNYNLDVWKKFEALIEEELSKENPRLAIIGEYACCVILLKDSPVRSTITREFLIPKLSLSLSLPRFFG